MEPSQTTQTGATTGTTATQSNLNPSAYVINLQSVAGGTGTTPPTDEAAALLSKFAIPDAIKSKYPELIQLVLASESMTDDERQYWFQILPIMTEDQVKKFREILDAEKKQLETLDKEYEAQLTKLNTKHDIEWKEFETKEKRREIEKKEEKAKTEDQATQDELLNQLSQL